MIFFWWGFRPPATVAPLYWWGFRPPTTVAPLYWWGFRPPATVAPLYWWGGVVGGVERLPRGKWNQC